MAISPTDPIETLTNAQCALLRDELLALLRAAGLAAPTVRQTKRRLRMGIDMADDLADARAEAEQVELQNIARRAEMEALEPIRRRRQARAGAGADYGAD